MKKTHRIYEAWGVWAAGMIQVWHLDIAGFFPSHLMIDYEDVGAYQFLYRIDSCENIDCAAA